MQKQKMERENLLDRDLNASINIKEFGANSLAY